MERLIDPIVTDLRVEYAAARTEGRVWRGRWTCVANYVAFWTAVGAHMGERIRAAVREWVSVDDWAAGRMLLTAALVTAGVVALLMLPFLVHVPERLSDPRFGRLILALVPQAIPIAIPAGVLCSVLWIGRSRARVLRMRRAILAMGVCTSLIAFLHVAWVMPAANQAFRTMVAGASVARGAHELTLQELSARMAALDENGDSRDARLLRLSYHGRLAIAVAPFTFAWLAFALVGLKDRNRGSRGVGAAGLTIYVLYFALIGVRHAVGGGLVSPLTIAWGPNVVVVLLAMLLHQNAAQRTQPEVTSASSSP